MKTPLFGIASLTLLAAGSQALARPELMVSVRDQRGNALSDAKVTVVGPERSDFRMTSLTTDRSGTADFRFNLPGKYLVFVTLDDYRIENREVNVSDTRLANVDVTMNRGNGQKILVLVRSQDTNEGISRADVVVHQGRSGQEQRFTTRSGGYATIPIQDDPSARYMIDVSHTDFDPAGSVVQSRSRGDHLTVLNLRRHTIERMVSLRLIDSQNGQPIRNGRVTFENGADRRSASTGSDGTLTVRLPQRASYKVTVEGDSYYSITDRIDLGRIESSTYTHTYEMRRGNGDQTTGPGGRYQRGAKLDGDIRMKKSRYNASETVSVDLGVSYSESQNTRMPATINMELIGPSGRTVNSNSFRLDLGLNDMVRKNVDYVVSDPGVYTVRVTATGNGMRSWTSSKTFTVDRALARIINPEGIYEGTIDLINLNGDRVSHVVAMKLSKKGTSLYSVTGNLAPGRNAGFHISFMGTYDYGRKSLNAIGDMADDNQRWDIRISGDLDGSDRMVMNVSIRQVDGKYNRSANARLAKK